MWKNWRRAVDSQDDDYDIESALDAELEKYAATYDEEAERQMIANWQQTRDPAQFAQLYDVHKPVIMGAIRRVYGSSPLPRSAVEAHALRFYVEKLDTFDPTMGAKFTTHATPHIKHRVGRYANRYSNVGRIDEERSSMLDLLVDRKRFLSDALGRTPTDNELYSDMRNSAEEYGVREERVTERQVSTLNKELRSDLTAEQVGGSAYLEGQNEKQRQAIFMHGSLNDEQKLVLEHTFPGWGKPNIDSPEELSKQISLSPQKIRAIRAQILRKLDKYENG